MARRAGACTGNRLESNFGLQGDSTQKKRKFLDQIFSELSCYPLCMFMLICIKVYLRVVFWFTQLIRILRGSWNAIAKVRERLKSMLSLQPRVLKLSSRQYYNCHYKHI